MPADPQMLARLLKSGAYDRYTEEFVNQLYGRGSLSPYAMQRMQREAPQTVERLMAEGLVNRGPGALTEQAALEEALQGEIRAQMAGYGSRGRTDTGPRLVELLSQWRSKDPMSPEGILAKALYDDPSVLTSLILSSMPSGYGGVFSKAYRDAISRGIEDAAYAGPEQGDYLSRIGALLSGITKTPVNVSASLPVSATSTTRAPTSMLPSITSSTMPDRYETLRSLMGSNLAAATNPTAGLGKITPEELFALRQLAGE